MKLKAEILSVSVVADQLLVRAQANEVGAGSAPWRSMAIVEFKVSDIAARRRAFYVGRTLTIKIEPEGR